MILPFCSRMTSERVRPVIECLCQILSVYDFSTVTSESFRLAKFDRNEVVRAHEHARVRQRMLCRLDRSVLAVDIRNDTVRSEQN